MVLDSAEHAESIDDAVRNEVGGGVAGAAVVGVVVVRAVLDVVGKRLRQARRIVAVAFDEIGHVVADHSAEPAQLLALMGDVVTDVGWRDHTGGDRARRAPLRRGGLHDRGPGPFEDLRVGELQDEAVGVASDAVERAGAVAGSPHGELPAVLHPRKPEVRPVVIDRLAGHQALDHPHGLDHLGQRPGLAPDHPQRRVAAPDAADCPRAVGVVQRREGRSEHRPVARAGVGHHRTDDDPLGLGQDPGEDDERLLPQHRRVEHPHVGKAVRLGPLGELDHAPGRGIGLQYDAEVHRFLRSPTFWQRLVSDCPRPPLPSRRSAYQGTMPASTARVETRSWIVRCRGRLVRGATGRPRPDDMHRNPVTVRPPRVA